MEENTPNWEAMYKNAAIRISELEKENEQLRKELEVNEDYEDKLQDRVDSLEQIIVLLTKIYL